ncbi:MAG: Maf-like protein [Gammaproteobacteria bacterium]|nr:Maf-like protein [Gammaproteobacteria bacterium]
MTLAVQVLLASGSPRRRELLTQIGVQFELILPDCDEQILPGEAAEQYVARVALDKARAGWAMAAQRNLPVLGADTSVIVDQQILGKPVDQTHAAQMLRALAGRTHRVLTAVALVQGTSEQIVVQQSMVRMRAISDQEMTAYWNSGEPQGKAGGYAVQGLGAIFIEHIEGSYSGIMGLPVFETAQLLQRFGVGVLFNEELK